MHFTTLFWNLFTFKLIAQHAYDQIDAAKPIPEVFEDVKAIFAPYAKVTF